MENRTIQELFSRKSVRVFSDEKITEEEKRLILEAAIQAPTAGNMSLFSILDIQTQRPFLLRRLLFQAPYQGPSSLWKFPD